MKWYWKLPTTNGPLTCEAYTKSDARNTFKRMLGIPGKGRLSPGVTIQKMEEVKEEKK